jgi:hypothetical protein
MRRDVLLATFKVDFGYRREDGVRLDRAVMSGVLNGVPLRPFATGQQGSASIQPRIFISLVALMGLFSHSSYPGADISHFPSVLGGCLGCISLDRSGSG